jgi:hypothetical protein
MDDNRSCSSLAFGGGDGWVRTQRAAIYADQASASWESNPAMSRSRSEPPAGRRFSTSGTPKLNEHWRRRPFCGTTVV